MSVALVGNVIRIVGPARIEDAEPLASLLQSGQAQAVDLSEAGPLHAAVLQALLAFRPSVTGPASDPFVAAWLMPLLADTAMAFAAGAAPVAIFPLLNPA